MMFQLFHVFRDVQSIFFTDFHSSSLILVFCLPASRDARFASDPDLCVAYTVFPPSTSATRVFIWQVLLVLGVSGANIIPTQATIARTGRRQLETCCTSTSDAAATRAKDGA